MYLLAGLRRFYWRCFNSACTRRARSSRLAPLASLQSKTHPADCREVEQRLAAARRNLPDSHGSGRER